MCLRSPNYGLEKLSISYNDLTDKGIQFWGRTDQQFQVEKSVDAACCDAVTPSGWSSFLQCLQNPSTALVELDLTHNNINDEVMIAFAIAHNITLHMWGNFGITLVGWRHLGTRCATKRASVQFTHPTIRSILS